MFHACSQKQDQVPLPPDPTTTGIDEIRRIRYPANTSHKPQICLPCSSSSSSTSNLKPLTTASPSLSHDQKYHQQFNHSSLLAKNQSRQRPFGLPTGYLKQRSGKKRKIQISREKSRTKNEKERKPKLVAASFLLQVFIGDTAGTGKEEMRRSIRSPHFFTLPATGQKFQHCSESILKLL